MFVCGQTLLSFFHNIHKAHIIAAASCELNRGVLVITPDEPSATRLSEDINSFLPGKAELYPVRDFFFREAEGISREYEHARLKVLSKLLLGSDIITVAPLEAVLQYTIPPDILKKLTRTMCVSEEYNLNELSEFLLFSGYQRTDQVDGVSQFSIRGGILDIYSPDSPSPVRIEFWGDEIDTISYFDIETQRRTDPIDSLTITPAKEILYPSCEKLADMLEKKSAELKGKAGVKAKEIIGNNRIGYKKIKRRNINRLCGQVPKPYIPCPCHTV